MGQGLRKTLAIRRPSCAAGAAPNERAFLVTFGRDTACLRIMLELVTGKRASELLAA